MCGYELLPKSIFSVQCFALLCTKIYAVLKLGYTFSSHLIRNSSSFGSKIMVSIASMLYHVLGLYTWRHVQALIQNLPIVRNIERKGDPACSLQCMLCKTARRKTEEGLNFISAGNRYDSNSEYEQGTNVQNKKVSFFDVSLSELKYSSTVFEDLLVGECLGSSITSHCFGHNIKSNTC